MKKRAKELQELRKNIGADNFDKMMSGRLKKRVEAHKMTYFERVSAIALRDMEEWERKRAASVGLEKYHLELEMRREKQEYIKNEVAEILDMLKKIKKGL